MVFSYCGKRVRCSSITWLFAAALFMLGACDKKKPPAPTTAPKISPVVERLLETRKDVAEAQQRSASWLNPQLPDRIDQIVSLVQKEGSQALRENPRVLNAFIRESPHIVGAEVIGVLAVGPLSPVQRVEIFDETGRILGASGNVDKELKNGNWVRGTKDVSHGIGMFAGQVYVAPSIYDPPNQAPSPGVSEGRIEMYEVIKLPPDWGQRPVFVRLVMESGQRTDSVRLWKEPPISQPAQ